MNNTGILLANIGTPSAPTVHAVRHYLKNFLSDRRVVEIPRWLWWPILYGVILPLRSQQSAKRYQSIWTDEGSPLLVYSQKIAKKLEQKLQIPVRLGMHYSKPSIPDALHELVAKKVSRIIILPLYPQYSATTTASTFDAVTNVLRTWRNLPEIHTIKHYANNPHYIEAICTSIRNARRADGNSHHILFSFHGIPAKFVESGDPYALLCRQSTESIVKELELDPGSWSISFQSRLGKAKWLSPYTEQVLATLPQKGIYNLDVICPGFATDCLETLEEIKIHGAKQFLRAGGKSFRYIPALNDSDEHISMLEKIIYPSLQSWV